MTFAETLKQVFTGAPSEEEATSAVDILKADHRKVEDLFKSFEDTEDKESRFEIVKEIVSELIVHSTIEEQLVYPVLMKDESEEKTREAFEEHHVVKVLLAELSEFDGQEANLQAKVKVLKEMVKHHIREEELDMLPKLSKETDVEELGAKVKEQKEFLTANPPSLKKEEAVEEKPEAAKRKSADRKATSAKAAQSKSTAKKPATKKKAFPTKSMKAKKPAAKKTASKAKTTTKPKSGAAKKKSSTATKTSKSKTAKTKTSSAKKSNIRSMKRKHRKAS